MPGFLKKVTVFLGKNKQTKGVRDKKHYLLNYYANFRVDIF